MGRVACACQSMQQVFYAFSGWHIPVLYCACSGILTDSGYVLHALWSEWGRLLR